MAGNDVTGSFTPKRRLTADSNRSPNCETTERTALSINNGPVLPRPNAAKRQPPPDWRQNPGGARPGLLRADLRPEFRPANAAAGEIAAAIGHPHDQQYEYQCGETLDGVEAHQHRGDFRRRRIEKSRRNPVPPFRCNRYRHDETDASTISATSIRPIAKQNPATASATTPGTLTRVAPARPTTVSHSRNRPIAASVTSVAHSQPPA